jgi:hypothetical protein
MHQVPKSTPEAVSVQLESFSEPITMYRFDAVQQLQQHLPDAIFMVISKLNVNPDPMGSNHPTTSHMREVTDGSWHGEVVSRILGRSSGLPPILTKISLNDELQKRIHPL